LELLKLTELVDGYEIDPDNGNFLCLQNGTHGFSIGDFLASHSTETYDRVVMNPPFARNAAPKHVLHAYDFLKPGGRLVSVMPSSVTFRTDALNDKVRYLAKHIETLPEEFLCRLRDQRKHRHCHIGEINHY
jgi:hypothetical protein